MPIIKSAGVLHFVSELKAGRPPTAHPGVTRPEPRGRLAGAPTSLLQCILNASILVGRAAADANPADMEQSHQPAIGSVPWSRCGQRDRDHRMSRGPILRAARISSRFCRYSVSADFAESIALMRASSAISGRRLRVRFGHVVGGSEAGSGVYRICPPCGDLQSVISTLRSPTPSL